MAASDPVDEVTVLLKFTSPRGVEHRRSRNQILTSVIQDFDGNPNNRGMVHELIQRMEADGHEMDLSAQALDGKRVSWKRVAKDTFREKAESQHALGAAEVAIDKFRGEQIQDIK